MTPTARTLKFLRDAGYACGVVERRNHYAGPPDKVCPACKKNRIGLTQDLFGWCDVIAAHPAKAGSLYVQTTTGSNHASRRKKVLASEEAKTVLRANNTIWVLTWAKKGRFWLPRIEDVLLGHFPEPTEAVPEAGLFAEGT